MSKKFYGNTLFADDEGICFRFVNWIYAVDNCGDLFSASVGDLSSTESFQEFCQLPYEGNRFFGEVILEHCSDDFKTVIRLGLTHCRYVVKRYYDDYVEMVESSDEEDKWLADRVESAKKHLENLEKLIAKC